MEHRASGASSQWTDPVLWAVLLGVGAVSARLAAAPGSRLLGHTLSEAPGHLWMQWLLERGGPWFGQTDVLLGERLWAVPTDWTGRLVAGLLGLLLGPIAAYNLTAVGLLALAGTATAALARQRGAGTWPAALAALLVIWSPAVLGFVADGRLDSMGVGWVALLALSWVAAMRTPSWRSGAVMGAAAALVVLSGPNLTVATVLAAVPPTAAAVALDRRRLRPVLASAAVAGAAAALVLAVIYLVERNDSGRLEQVSNVEERAVFEVVDAETIAARRLADFWVGASTLNRAVPVGSAWSIPPEIHDNPATANAASMTTVQPYAPGAWWRLSLVPAALALVGLLGDPRRAGPWAIFGGALLVLGMGHGSSQTLPLVIGGQYTYIAPAVLIERIPGISVFNNYGLFSTFAAVALAVAAALGAQRLPRAPGVAVLAAGLWLVEVSLGPAPVPLAVNDMRLPDGLAEALAAVPEDRAVFFLPISKDLNNYLQTHHGRPSLMRFRFGAAGPADEPMLADPNGSVNDLLRAVRGQRPPRPDLRLRLQEGGIGAVVVMPSLLPPEAGRLLQQRTQQALGTPDWSDGERQVYRLTGE